MTTIDRHDAEYLMQMIAMRDAGTLEINHYCPECDLEFDSMQDARLRDGHLIIPHMQDGMLKGFWSGEFTIVIACEGYHIMTPEGKIKTDDRDDEGVWEIADGDATLITD